MNLFVESGSGTMAATMGAATESGSRIFSALVSSSPLDRAAAAAELADLLEEKHSTEHHRRVGELIASAEPLERAGGLAAIGALLQIDGEDLGPRLSTYAAPLRTALLRSVGTNAEVLGLACDYYGELVRRGRDRDKLEAEVRCALDALSDEADSGGERGGGGRGDARERPEHPLEARLLVAVLTLRQLIVHAPAAIYPHVSAALDLWRPLTFASLQVRFAATDALYALLVLVAPRATRYVQQWHKQLLAGAVHACERDGHSTHSMHGGMLALTW